MSKIQLCKTLGSRKHAEKPKMWQILKIATFERIKPIVRGFFQIGFRFEKISGRLNSFKSGIFHFCYFMFAIGELSRSSQDLFESDSDSKESRDDRPNSLKSGKFCHILVFRRVFGLQASYRAETLTPDRSRGPRRGKKSKNLSNRSNRSIQERDRPIDRSIRSIDGRRASPCLP